MLGDQPKIWIKKAIWFYFYLLIFEGALRKWVLPGLAEPLLIIRDPLAVYILFKVIHNNIWRPNLYVNLIWGASALSFILTLLLGHGNIPVAVFGLRITLLHFPLIFIIGTVLDKDDVLKMGKIILWLTIGMTILVAIQFYSPQTSWVNRGVGGDMSGSGFSGVEGFYRVPGTFSFTNGLSLFYGLAAAFIFYFWVGERREQVPQYLLIGSTVALLAAIPLSISRTVLFQTLLSIIFLLVISGKNQKVIKKLMGVGIAGIASFFVLGNFNFFQTASNIFTKRYTMANEAEGGIQESLIDRVLGGMYGALVDPETSIWGLGLGLGSKVGSKLMTGGTGAYLISEGEWGRVLGEMGLVLGFFVILVRGSLVFHFTRKAWSSVSIGNALPWLLLSFGTINLLQGQWAQPTSLGFSILIGGLIVASFKHTESSCTL